MEYKALTLEEKLDLCINTLVHAYLKEGDYNTEITETLLRIKPSAVMRIRKALNPELFEEPPNFNAYFKKLKKVLKNKPKTKSVYTELDPDHADYLKSAFIVEAGNYLKENGL